VNDDCVRCGLPEDRHPVGAFESKTGEALYCVHYDAPAPLWMQAMNGILGRLR